MSFLAAWRSNRRTRPATKWTTRWVTSSKALSLRSGTAPNTTSSGSNSRQDSFLACASLAIRSGTQVARVRSALVERRSTDLPGGKTVLRAAVFRAVGPTPVGISGDHELHAAVGDRRARPERQPDRRRGPGRKGASRGRWHRCRLRDAALGPGGMPSYGAAVGRHDACLPPSSQAPLGEQVLHAGRRLPGRPCAT
jgi:hypothetical protein